MGRPKISDDTIRSINFTVRLTESEFKKLEALAAFCGKAPGVLIRDKVFNGRFPDPKRAKIDRDTYYELKKIGVNLNQLTRLANSGRVPAALVGLIMKLQNQQELIINILIHDSGSENR